MIKVAIIGHGFVGKAISASYEGTDVEVMIVDPHSGDATHTLEQAHEADAFFVSVPSPSLEDGGCDGTIVDGVLQRLPVDALVILKSTVTPDWIDRYNEYDLRLVYAPEFLTEAYSVEDYINTPMHYLGGDSEDCMDVKRILSLSKCDCNETYFTDARSASLLKYTINTFLAMKVVFMNEIYAIHSKSGADSKYADLVEMIIQEGRLGTTHLNVPGPDGKLGFGGGCFPKDTQAFLKYSKDMGVDLSVLQQACEKNEILR